MVIISFPRITFRHEFSRMKNAPIRLGMPQDWPHFYTCSRVTFYHHLYLCHGYHFISTYHVPTGIQSHENAPIRLGVPRIGHISDTCSRVRIIANRRHRGIDPHLCHAISTISLPQRITVSKPVASEVHRFVTACITGSDRILYLYQSSVSCQSLTRHNQFEPRSKQSFLSFHLILHSYSNPDASNKHRFVPGAPIFSVASFQYMLQSPVHGRTNRDTTRPDLCHAVHSFHNQGKHFESFHCHKIASTIQIIASSYLAIPSRIVTFHFSQ
ncbi:hypothetical protein AB205_0041260, partial [Aquarana catesbeiana]